jgi:two-component sensor histidine kinase
MRLGQELRVPISSKVAPPMGFTAIKRENEQLRFVTEELHHRIKNLVAIIQSIARQTMQQAGTGPDVQERFSGRLAALGRSLDLLIDDNWDGARIDELVRQQLAPFGYMDGISISAEGPAVDLNPDAARNIGLALHELATNASKHGSLSVPQGRVDLHWELVGSGAGQSFRIAWRESGGPIVTEPTQWGFGRQVIQRVIAESLEGTVTHEFPPDGVRWTLDIPTVFVVGTPDALVRTEAAARNERH